MSVEMDRDMINDGDVLKVVIYEGHTEPSVSLELSHRANGLDINLTKSEIEWLLSNLRAT